MKILHVITGLNNGGAEKIMCDLAIHDAKNGLDVHVISLMGKGFWGGRLISNGVKLTTLEMPRGSISFSGLVLLYKTIRKNQPDIVQSWMYHANLVGGTIAKLAGVKSIFWGIHHANFDKKHNSKKTIAIIKISAFLSAWIPEKIISCSVNATQLHKALGYSSEKFINIPNGYDMELLKPSADGRMRIRNELKIPDNSFVIGMVARYDPQKDHQNLFNSLKTIKQLNKNFFCILAGQGMVSTNNELITLINSFGIGDSIKLLGQRNDIPDIMSALDLHILSSLGEAFPNVLAEAMSCETPCVSTEVGDAKLIVGGYGWVVPSQNSDELSAAILKAFSMFNDAPTSWHELKQKCRVHISRNFSLEKMCESYNKAWASLINRNLQKIK